MISNSFFNYDRSSHSLGSKVYHVLNEYPPCRPYWFSMNREDLGLKDPCIVQHMRSLFLSLVVAILLVSECLRVNFRPFFCCFRVYDTLFSN